MGIYDSFADAPNRIRTEGQEITIKFQRIGDGTARISWNIPPPARGCSADQLAYDGIVITVSSVPANYLTTSPKDGTYYESDPTADYDVHSGSRIDRAYVVAAIYHDKTTTVVDIDGIKPKTPYYISGYAVDSVGRYHREGVHAYSIPTGIQSYTTEDFPATHTIKIHSVNPITTNSRTGLLPTNEYTLPIKIECKIEEFKINGAAALTYGNLVDEINNQFAAYGNTYAAPTPPKTGNYYKSGDAFFLWSGSALLPVNATVTNLKLDGPPVIGTYWFSPETNLLSVYTDNGWEAVLDIIKSEKAPTERSPHEVWFDGGVVRVWEGGQWCDYTTIFSERDPRLPAQLMANDYWYNSAESELFKWNDVLHKWDDALAIFFDRDPNTLNSGTFWYDETAGKIKRFVGGKWNVMSGVIYAKSNLDGQVVGDDALAVTGGVYWFDTRRETFFRRNFANTAWVAEAFVSFPIDPRNRSSCDLWWNSSPSIDDLFVWESITASWVPVGNFFRSPVDPNSPPIVSPTTAWVLPDGTIRLLSPTDCAPVNYIYSIHDPRTVSDGAIWLDLDGSYHIYANGSWEAVADIVRSNDAPYSVFDGKLWFSPIEQKLYRYSQTGGWEASCILFDKSIFPAIGDQWFDTVNSMLFEWTGGAWVPSRPFIQAIFVPRKCMDDYESIQFLTRKTGCHEAFEVMSTGNTLLASLGNTVIYTDPLDGSDGMDAGPMYRHIGVGDDGSPDERRALHEEIRFTLGAPAVRVELTKQQIDRCIDNALLVLRKHSTYSYKRGMFFMDFKSNQQVYKLTNRCVGFNKIVDVLAVRRTKAGAFRTAYSQNDNFAFAALQQLYTLGTFDMLTFHLTSSYVEELEVLFASRIMYQWVERKRELRVYQIPRSGERVLIEAIIERTEQELLTDRETAYWLKRWAIIEAKGMLAQIRGKFATLPGPNSTTTLNATDLRAQLDAERRELLDEVQSKAMQDLTDIGMKAHFVIG